MPSSEQSPSCRSTTRSWAAWRRTWQLEDRTEVQLDDQVALVVAFIDPVYTGDVGDGATWDRGAFEWRGSTTAPAAD